MQPSSVLQAAHDHYRAGRYHQAEVIYRQLLAADSQNAAAWHGLGLIALAAGRRDAALSCLRQAVSLNPTDQQFRQDLRRIEQPATIRIYQIFFDDASRTGVEQAAIPFDNSREPSPRQFEYGVFRRLYQEGIAEEEIVGAVSWKFPEKAQLPVAGMKQMIADNPGFDLYLFDPPRYEVLPYLTWNCWRQGECWHGREATDAVARMFGALADYRDIDLRRFRTSPATNIYCNYWAGNRRGWDTYMAFVEPLYQALTRDESLAHRMFVCGLPGHRRYGTHGFFPYVIERMMPTLLAARRHGLRVWRWEQTASVEGWLRENGFADCIAIARRIDAGPADFDVDRVAERMNFLYAYFQTRTENYPPPPIPYAAVVAAIRGELGG